MFDAIKMPAWIQNILPPQGVDVKRLRQFARLPALLLAGVLLALLLLSQCNQVPALPKVTDTHPGGKVFLDGGASLKGGERTKPEQAWDYAHAAEYTFVHTEEARDDLLDDGTLVRLQNRWWEIWKKATPYDVAEDVEEPFLLPTTRTFVWRLAEQYTKEGCGRLTITGALRMKELPNSSAFSVHGTGMAVDLRVPSAERCEAWLRQTLLTIERRGQVDATREKKPPHFHQVVLPREYAVWLEKQAEE